MMLEEIRDTYGMSDYLDVMSGRIFQLSKVIDNGVDLLVPVLDVATNNVIGYAHMSKQ